MNSLNKALGSMTLATYAKAAGNFPASDLLRAAASASDECYPGLGMPLKIKVPGIGRVFVALVVEGGDIPYAGKAVRGGPHQAGPFEGGRPDQRAMAIHAWVH